MTHFITRAGIAAAGIFLLPFVLLAHGGIEKSTGGITVYINQIPVSPYVGEPVGVNFVFRNSDNLPLKNLPVELELIDTFYGDPLKDETILVEKKTTDANGSFNFEYTFDKEDYFDLDLLFADPVTGEARDVGYLIEPREKGVSAAAAAGAGVLAALAGFFAGRAVSSKKARSGRREEAGG